MLGYNSAKVEFLLYYSFGYYSKTILILSDTVLPWLFTKGKYKMSRPYLYLATFRGKAACYTKGAVISLGRKLTQNLN